MKYIGIILLIILCSCKSEKSAERTENRLFIVEGEYVTVADNSPVAASIELEEVATAEYKTSFVSSCAVRAIPARYAEIASPFAGRIVKSFVRLGQRVEPGDPILELHSPAFYEAVKSYNQAKQEMELAGKSLNRERDLRSNRIGSEKSLEEAEVSYELKRQEYELSAAALAVYQIKPTEIVPGQALIIRAPIHGEVVKENIVTGQYIREDADALAIVADLSKVRVVAHVKEKDLPYMNYEADVEIRLIALPERIIPGKIYHIGDMLDEETRSVEVVIECDNPKLEMKPAMYGSVTFVNVPSRTLAVPRQAILQDEDSRYVLVSEGGNKFRKAYIKVAAEDKGDLVPILSGVKAGDRIVSKGAFYFINAR